MRKGKGADNRLGVSHRLRQIVVSLYGQPCASRTDASAFQPDGKIGADSGLTIQDAG